MGKILTLINIYKKSIIIEVGWSCSEPVVATEPVLLEKPIEIGEIKLVDPI